MGYVRVRTTLANPERRTDGVEVQEALVDTGATWTTIPRDVARKPGLQVIGLRESEVFLLPAAN